MRVLFVEDDEAFARSLAEEISVRVDDIHLVLVQGRDEAMTALENDEFDLLVCDLSIPTSSGQLDEDIDHGLIVRARAGEVSPGTPLIVFSAKAKLHHVKPFVREGHREDIFGDRKDCPMIEYYEKDDLVEVVDLLEEYGGRFRELEHIEVATAGIDLGLSRQEKLIIQLLARRSGGEVAHIRPIGGGLSGSRIVRIKTERSGGGGSSLVVAKISAIADVTDERERYQVFAAGVLPHGSYTVLADEVIAGAGPVGGISYALLEGYEASLFDVARDDDAAAAEVTRRLRANVAVWTDGVPPSPMSVKDLRRLLISDEEADRIWPRFSGIDIASAEAVDIHARVCPQHGDLHCGNVLVNEYTEPVVIDFGSCLRACASLDPITLELCFLFHPDAAGHRAGWNGVDVAAAWPDVDEVIQLTDRAEFVSSVRGWAYEVAGGDLEVLAAVYAYALRQFRYSDTDKDVAEALVRMAVDRLISR